MSGKEFDCVEMKHAIQRKLLKENAGRSWSERNAKIRKALSRDPHLSRLLEAAGTTHENGAPVSQSRCGSTK